MLGDAPKTPQKEGKITANRKRKIRISVRLTEEEHRELLKKCELTGLSIEGLVRKLIDGNEIRARPTKEYLKLEKGMAAIGNNINQVAHVANLCKCVKSEQIQQLIDMMGDLWDLLWECR